MRVVRIAMTTLIVIANAISLAAQPFDQAQGGQPAKPPTPGQPASPTPGQQQPPGQPTPGQPAPAQPTPGQPGTAPAAPAAPPQPRTFTAPVGLLFNTVRADRVEDFEQAMGYLQAALASSTNERVRAQAAGWRIFKATEAAPGGAVLYVYVIDPTVMAADYSLSRILADAYPDEAKLREIWKLYSGSVTGGSLLNLTPLKVAPPTTDAIPVIEKPVK